MTLLSRTFLRSPRSFLPAVGEAITLTRYGEIWARVQTTEPEPIQTNDMETIDLDEIGWSFATRERIRSAVEFRHVLVALQSAGVAVAWLVPSGCSAEALREEQRIQQLRVAHQNGACEDLTIWDKFTLSGLDMEDALDRLLWHGTAEMGAPPSMIEKRPAYYNPNTGVTLDVAEWVSQADQLRLGGGSS